mmetsp:Transcript_5361/g.13049  ORF Transcript_5361/g.13049 Transcript_5361/m.13049 type:complete len:241 (+) Transcript_5361:715-1437(+)
MRHTFASQMRAKETELQLSKLLHGRHQKDFLRSQLQCESMPEFRLERLNRPPGTPKQGLGPSPRLERSASCRRASPGTPLASGRRRGPAALVSPRPGEALGAGGTPPLGHDPERGLESPAPPGARSLRSTGAQTDPAEDRARCRRDPVGLPLPGKPGPEEGGGVQVVVYCDPPMDRDAWRTRRPTELLTLEEEAAPQAECQPESSALPIAPRSVMGRRLSLRSHPINLVPSHPILSPINM